MRALMIGFVLLCVGDVPVWAQKVSPIDCASAAAYVSGQPLPAPNDTTLAWYALAMCGNVGEAAAVQALQTTSVVSESDSARVQRFVTMFSLRRTSALFNAWQALILNPQASDIFKRLAVDVYATLYHPGTSFATPTLTATSIAACGTDIQSSGPSPDGTLSDLPGDALTQLVTTMSSAANNAANSLATRAEANCWRLRLQMLVPPIAANIQATYLCGNKFSLINTNTAPVFVEADVIPPNALQKIETHGSTLQASGGAWVLPAQMRGNLRVTFNGAVIQTVVNTGRTCP